MSFVIRDATADDFEAVGALNVDVYVGEGFSPRSATATLLAVGERAARNTTIIATEGTTGEVVGAICLAHQSDLVQVAQEDEAEIRILAVTSRATHCTLGRR